MAAHAAVLAFQRGGGGALMPAHRLRVSRIGISANAGQKQEIEVCDESNYKMDNYKTAWNYIFVFRATTPIFPIIFFDLPRLK
ncbi:MAG: hypothetical protein B7Z58_01820 [Acidiphilium sp. 37-64-53]|nr:MAG: hypothetical protein B7Z58_01820 [Acidiphilium sp. 37-64-53]